MQNLLNFTFENIDKYIGANENKSAGLLDFKSPAELNKLVDFAVGENGLQEGEFKEALKNYLDYSVNTGHKQFLNQLYSGFNLPAFIGEMITALTNTSMYTYEVAPMATMIEKEMIRLMNSFVGYTDGDGIFTSGGSNGNLLAMLSARNKLFPEGRFTGYENRLKLKAFVSDQAHYSFETAANIIGIGSKNVVKVQSDKNGKMIPAALERAIKKSLEMGETPFFVAATCATTLLGAYDPIDQMSEICRKYNLWLHADGSFGGSLIISKKHRHLIKGLEQTDSFVWNPHKLMNIPLVCSTFLVKNKDTLYKNITDINTDYIFHNIDAVEDLGKKSIQCGRRVDAVKLWFAWKYYGKNGYENRINHSMSMAKYAEEKVKSHPSLELLADRQSFAVCFRYIPEYKTDINEFNLKVREKLRKEGKTIVNYGFHGKTLAIRLVIANAELQKEDIDLFFHYFTTAAKELSNIKQMENEFIS
ncbi:MAG: aspartate aminotransferase family protein [Bacteroidales bacterium]|nr:aspartate aminotransferase family protein [Bacteroidales bacterium]